MTNKPKKERKGTERNKIIEEANKSEIPSELITLMNILFGGRKERYK